MKTAPISNSTLEQIYNRLGPVSVGKFIHLRDTIYVLKLYYFIKKEEISG